MKSLAELHFFGWIKKMALEKEHQIAHECFFYHSLENREFTHHVSCEKIRYLIEFKKDDKIDTGNKWKFSKIIT